MPTKKPSTRVKKVKDEVEEPQVTPVEEEEVSEVSQPKAGQPMAENLPEVPEVSEEDNQTSVQSDISESTEAPTRRTSESSGYGPRTASASEGYGESKFDRPRYSRPSEGGYQNRGYDNRGDRRYDRGGYDRGGDRYENRGYDRGGYDRGGYDRGGDRFERDTEEEIQVPVKGILDIQHEGHGFLRPKFRASDKDIYISSSQIRRFWLRNGDLVEGVGRPPKDNERYFGLLKIEKVNEKTPEESLTRPSFDDLTAIYPDKQVMLATGKDPLSTRIIDLVSPIGFGQRGMIVSPPKAGKTTIMKNIAEGISANHPEVHLMAILIGERPEEVTDISRSVKGEVIASNFDESPETQTRIAEIAMDRAKRLVEEGKQVVVLLDSITRLARAYNLAVDPSGRTLSGGFDPAALYPAKKFFGAARNCEEGGSLTIIGTALVDTGSRMDDLIFEEFKGTGNMEVHLDRRLADRRIFPAINVEKSGTREEARILPEDVYKKVVLLRRMIDVLNPDERTEVLIERLQKTADNKEFLDSLAVPKE